jgi:hypothetical protein
VAGATDSFGQGQGDFWILKLRGDGIVEWQKTFGGARLDYAYSIQQTNDGGYIVAGESASFDPRTSGSFEGSCGFLDTGCFDAWILKLTPEGSIEWQKSYGGAAYDGAKSIQQTSDGGYVVAGQTSSFEGGWYGWAFKLDQFGSLKWDRIYGGSDGNDAKSIRQTAGGNYILVGVTSSLGAGSEDVVIFKLDDIGNVGGCPLVGQCDTNVANTNVVGNDTNVAGRDTSVAPLVNAISVLSSSASVSEICYATGLRPPLRWEWQDWLDRIIECSRTPVPGSYFPRCPPPQCPECLFLFSMYATERKVPDYLPSLYREILLWLSLPERYFHLSDSSINQLEGLFGRAQAGLNYDPSLMKEVSESLKQIKRTGEVNPLMAGKLAEAVSAIELDLSNPSRIIKKVAAGEKTKIDLEGMAWLSLKNPRKAGTIALQIRNGFPAALPGFNPPWPVFTYDFEGTSLEADSIDVSFYFGGISLIGQLPEVRLFEWDGKVYMDITANVDKVRKVVTGRTHHLAEYVVVTPDLNVRPGKSLIKK